MNTEKHKHEKLTKRTVGVQYLEQKMYPIMIDDMLHKDQQIYSVFYTQYTQKNVLLNQQNIFLGVLCVEN